MTTTHDSPLAVHDPTAPARRRVERVLGTTVVIEVAGTPSHADRSLERAADLLHQVDAWFDASRDDSPLAQLRAGALHPALAPELVQDVLARCREVRRLTEGAFDPWALPGGLDPAGYVAGWAAGLAADLLVRAGLEHVRVDTGGEVVCRGERAPGSPWVVDVPDPWSRGSLLARVALRDAALATSTGRGVIDPEDGSSCVWYDTATVVGPDPGLADALATACVVAGPRCAAWFGALPGWSVLLVKDGAASSFGPAFRS